MITLSGNFRFDRSYIPSNQSMLKTSEIKDKLWVGWGRGREHTIRHIITKDVK